MPKRLHVDLSSRRSRQKLRIKENSTPLWHPIAQGRFLGYRRLRGGGSWLARYYLGAGKYCEDRIGLADDSIQSDGTEVLTFSQAVRAALTWCDEQQAAHTGEVPRRTPYTVSDALTDYLSWYHAHRKASRDAELKARAHILPVLGTFEVEKLTANQLRVWHQSLGTSPARLRPAKVGPARTRPLVTHDDARRRKSTANRILTLLKAALNFAVHEGKVPTSSTAIWKAVQPFKAVDSPKIRFFDRQEIARLLEASAPDFRELVTGALLTGCRYGELAAMQVRDFLPASQGVQIPESKGGKSRMVFLTEEGAAFFSSLTAGKDPGDRLFLREDRSPWLRSYQLRPMREAAIAAELPAPNSFHVLRHTYASHYLMAGGSLPGLARQLGHADTRMTIRSYAHLANEWRAAEARQYGPRLGVIPSAEALAS